MSILMLFAIYSGVNDPVVAETPNVALQLFARQTRLSELPRDFGALRMGEVHVVQRRSADPVTEIALQLADAQLRFALDTMRYTERNPYLALQRNRVAQLKLTLSKLEEEGLTPDRNRVLRELQAMAATTSAQLDERLSIYTDANPQLEMLKQRREALTTLVNDYKQSTQ